jgi:hypothetical protein
MKIKVFYPNEKGHIELTKEKLEGLLNEAYNEGYRDGSNNNGYYCGITTTPYVSSISDSNIRYLSSTTPSLSVNTTEMLCDKAASSAISCCGKVTSSVIDDCCDKAVSAINCCVDTNAKTSAIDYCINANDGITADILEGKVKNAIIVEYAEASNEA